MRRLLTAVLASLLLAMPAHAQLILGCNDNWIGVTQANGRHGDIMTAGSGWFQLGSNPTAFALPGTPPPVGYACNAATANYARPGTYTLKATGKGSLWVFFQGTGAVTHNLAPPPQQTIYQAGTATFTGSESYQFTLPSTQHIGLRVLTSDAQAPLDNVQVIAPGASVNNGFVRLYHPEFLSGLKGFRVLRFMDPQVTVGSQEVNWADRNTRRGQDLESFIDLCNELQADPWFCVPHMAVRARTAPTDWCYRFGELIHARLDPARTVRLEYSDEIWNYGRAWWDETTWVGLQEQLEDDVPAALRGEYARLAHAAFTAIESRMPGRKVIRVFAGQLGNSQTYEAMLDEAKARGYRVDEIAGGAYWECYADVDAVKAAWAAGDRAKALQLIDRGYRDGFAQTASWLKACRDVAAQYGSPPMVAYEGGPAGASLWHDPQALPAIQAYVDDPLCEQCHLDAFAAFQGAGLTLLNYYSYCHPDPLWGARRNADDRTNRRYWACRRWITGGDPAWYDGPDAITKGGWPGMYGQVAAMLPTPAAVAGQSAAPTAPGPGGLSVTAGITYTWATSTTDPRGVAPAPTPAGAPAPAVAPAPSAVCWNDPAEIDLDVPGTGLQRLGLYLLDWNGGGNRSCKVEILSPDGATVLDTQSVGGYDGGVYLRWSIPGAVKVRITPTGISRDVVLSGVFLDPAP